ncbi:MAG TPA: acetamidase/formamidase family protein [Candidatus Dormibacteraeota bacterium]
MGTIAKVSELVAVRRYTAGLIGPSLQMDEVVKDGGIIEAITPPGCWGPMITPKFVGGHEVSWPVAVEGAKVGDAIAITIERVQVMSAATSSGTMVTKQAAFGSDPFVDKKCPGCGLPWPASRLEGTGEGAVRCAKCGAECSPFGFGEGYTIAFDEDRIVGLTVDEKRAHDFALRAREIAALPENSEQYPILVYEPHTIPGTLARLRSFIGNIGSMPSKDMPDSHNAGDFGSFLIGAKHRFAMSEQELKEHRTDGHLDCDSVRAGAVLLVPVKVDGGGIYIGDSHANQGDGELSLHTTDITANVRVRVNLLKGVKLEGPILLPVVEDLPWIARPFSKEELERGRALGQRYSVQMQGPMAPVQFIGTAATINEAADNAIERTANLLGLSQAEVRNRCTISGGLEIARLPGAVQLSMLVPLERLDRLGLGELVRRHYKLVA